MKNWGTFSPEKKWHKEEKETWPERNCEMDNVGGWKGKRDRAVTVATKMSRRGACHWAQLVPVNAGRRRVQDFANQARVKRAAWVFLQGCPVWDPKVIVFSAHKMLLPSAFHQRLLWKAFLCCHPSRGPSHYVSFFERLDLELFKLAQNVILCMVGHTSI